MLIIAIGFGQTTDPYTFTCVCEEDDLDPQNVESVIAFLEKEHDLLAISMDEILVIDQDRVLANYTYEDGLGQEYSEIEEVE